MLCSPDPSPVALSIYALPKTGSTFLGQFAKHLSVLSGMCKVLEQRHANCSVSIEAACAPGGFGGRLSCSHDKKKVPARGWFCSHAVQLNRTFTGCASGEASDGSDWLDREPMAWLLRQGSLSAFPPAGRSAAERLALGGTPLFDHGPAAATSVGAWTALHGSGFVRAPIRTASPPGRPASFVFPGFRSVVVVHTRHPVEALVSQFYCRNDSRVCPKQGRHAPSSAAPLSAGVDAFLLSELLGEAAGSGEPGGALRLLASYEGLTVLLREARALTVCGTGRKTGPSRGQSEHGATHGSSLEVLHSRYETMVTDFGGWLAVLLARLPLTDAARSELHSRLVARDGGDFVPDGKHRHSLTVGSNLARLQPVTVAALQRGAPRLGALMRSLGYLFTPPFVEWGGNVD